MKQFILAITLLNLLTPFGFSATLLHASANVGSTGQFTGGGAITSYQFLGTRFELASKTQISAIGGHFYSTPGSNPEIFGAIIELDSLTSLPEGAPFDSADMARIALSTTVNVPSSSSLDYVFPVSVTLNPGIYGLLFGKGQFGASGEGVIGAADGTANLSPDYMVWSQTGWGNGGFPNARLTVYGDPVPEPITASLFLLGVALFYSTYVFRPGGRLIPKLIFQIGFARSHRSS